MANRKRIIPIIAVLVLAGLLWFGKQWWYGRAHESTDNAQVDGHLVPVLAKVGGYVQAVSVQENDSVKEGQVLVRIDSSEYAVRLQQANAELAAARAARDKAIADLGRMRELAAKQIVSSQQLDAAVAAADAANANLQALERAAGAAGATVASAEAGVKLAQARLAGAAAAVANAKLQLEYTRVSAPASGTVSKKQVEVGQLVQAGQPLMTIVSDTGTFITANFKETQLADIRVGEPVDIDVDAYGCTAKGKVESVSAATGAKFALLPPDNATGNFTKVVQRIPVRIAVVKTCSATQPLRPGMSVNVHVATK
jgi:membrane fusion protein (multidrug efflux system)